MADLVGRTILHYRITEQVGQGGMGVVYKAEDTKLERTVALKFLSLASIGDEEKKRFKREAKAAASLTRTKFWTRYSEGISLLMRIAMRPGYVLIMLFFSFILTCSEGKVDNPLDPESKLPAPEILWSKTFGELKVILGRAIQLTNDAGYIVAGDTGSFPRDDLLLLKVNSLVVTP